MLYIVTDRRATAGRPLVDVLARALAGAAQAGADAGSVAVQLREKDLEARALLALARELRALTAGAGAALYINDRVDVALAVGADGVHLAGTSMTASEVRVITADLEVAVSAHDRPTVERASHDPGVRFAVLGPIFDTPSKRRFGPPLGLAALTATADLALPVLALGGITVENTGSCIGAGAAGVACIRAILSAPDPQKIAFLFFEKILEGGRTH